MVEQKKPGKTKYPDFSTLLAVGTDALFSSRIWKS